MEEHFSFHKMSRLENMMLNIQNEGKSEVWQLIENTANALDRCSLRKLYWEALRKLEE